MSDGGDERGDRDAASEAANEAEAEVGGKLKADDAEADSRV